VREGKGIYIYATGDQYEGDFMKEKRHGYGKMMFINSDSYEGEW
jgi:hypothetical protein